MQTPQCGRTAWGRMLKFPKARSDGPNVAALSSDLVDGTSRTCTIAIAVKAPGELLHDPFAYAYNSLLERKNCKVVVLCCMSRVRDELALMRPIDLQGFGGISKKKLDSAISDQMNILKNFLENFREELNAKGVELEIRICAGPRSHVILVEAAKALHPQWVVIDRSFSNRKKQIKAALECNLVLVKKGQQIEMLKLLPPNDQDPQDRSQDRVSEEVKENFISNSRLGSGASSPCSRRSGLRKRLKEFSSSVLCTGVTMGGSGADEQDGPTKNQTVVYRATATGTQAAYLRNTAPHLTAEAAVFPRRSTSSSTASASPGSIIWNNFENLGKKQK